MSFFTHLPCYRQRKFICHRPVLKYEARLVYYFPHVSSIHQPPASGPFAAVKRNRERFPLFINMSDERFRNDRARLLHQIIGQNLRTLREGKGLSITQVAEATAISVGHLQKVEAGTFRITPTMLVAISDYFRVSIEDIVYKDLSKQQ